MPSVKGLRQLNNDFESKKDEEFEIENYIEELKNINGKISQISNVKYKENIRPNMDLIVSELENG